MVTARKRRYRAGEIIFAEGEVGDCAYIIESGRVEIRVEDAATGRPVPLAAMGVGEIFGEMAVIDGSPRSASALAAEPCELAIVSREAISERIDAADPIVRLLISMLLGRMRGSNQLSRGEDAGLRLLEQDAPDSQAEVLEKMRLESELKQALEADEFELYYQPIVDLQTDEISGFEALIRWHSPSRGLVRPDVFMGIAEETSLIVPIGRWVIERASEAAATFMQHAGRELFVSVNVSTRQLHDVHFVDHLHRAVAACGLEPSAIKLEMTERLFMEGPTALHAIERCRDLGFQVALDDFGTGYSSLSYLAQFQVDNLKVDQTFVRRLLQDDRTFAVTEAIINMSHSLGIPVVAEGIETDEDRAALAGMDCRFGQGYFFARPIPLAQALDVITAEAEDADETAKSA